jgi:uncharacterized protein (DUF433 family)
MKTSITADDAMTTAAKLVQPHITKRHGVRGGKACIDQTRICVTSVVLLHKEGKRPEEILVAYPDLNLAQVHAALTYYYDHPAEIEAELADEEGWDERYERRRAEALAWRKARSSS